MELSLFPLWIRWKNHLKSETRILRSDPRKRGIRSFVSAEQLFFVFLLFLSQRERVFPCDTYIIEGLKFIQNISSNLSAVSTIKLENKFLSDHFVISVAEFSSSVFFTFCWGKLPFSYTEMRNAFANVSIACKELYFAQIFRNFL